MLILGIESSCDETAASVTKNGREVLSDVVYSQVDLHAAYGGVVPEIASRKHLEKIIWVVDGALQKAGVTKDDLDAVAVTNNPGLVGALLVGVSAAKALAYGWQKPLVPVNHIEGHICANYIAHKNLKPPIVCLVASGGHSHILLVSDYKKFKVLGATRDDAAGEAFDKVARAMGLGYPGGPKINRAAQSGNPQAIAFPRAKTTKDGLLDFSFSGLKTAVINYLHTHEQKGEAVNQNDVAASFQQAVVDVLVSNTITAARREGVGTVCLAGGVAANTCLRGQMEAACKKEGFAFYCPPPALCGDNGAMISCAGYYNFISGVRADLTLNAVAQLNDF